MTDATRARRLLIRLLRYDMLSMPPDDVEAVVAEFAAIRAEERALMRAEERARK
jgi:hypothetical protein